ncbi:ubiquitin carboxyl-terminal hydrolase 43-like [Trematomus bernacchii]|uniref:ubiquitin carboxyl-terminal hydrolase 43-like n=1 Tax=Trematomus bernacchii TaxID=40690 RepID=UPI00146B9436|nr:ubiquitin carboxyl-terminal hydrolase 43-like [Trematomus bernacchii]
MEWGLCGAEEVLSESRLQHSFVKEHFQAQYKSSLTCPHCMKQSNTFDPFLCISLPIPLRQTRWLCVVLVFSTKGQRYLRVGLAVPLFGSVATLRRMVADEGQISPDQVILTEVYSTGFHRSFFDEEDLTSIAENDVVYAFQAPPLYIRGGSARISGYHHSLPSSPYSSGPESQRLPSSGTLSSEFLNHGVPVKILLLVCNAAGTGQQAVRFGPPFLMREDRSVSWEQLQQSILSKLYYLMINGAQAQNIRVMFNVRVVGGSVFHSYLSPQDGRPLHHPAVDRVLKLCGSGGPPHVKLIIEWEHRIKDCVFGNIQEEVVQQSESGRSQQNVHQFSCSLDECFQLYTKEEQLAPDDAWKCPHCQQLQQGTVKMNLWTLPDILILHLKRFRQVGDRRNKLTTFVQFPLTGLDMTPHMVTRNHNNPHQSNPNHQSNTNHQSNPNHQSNTNHQSSTNHQSNQHQQQGLKPSRRSDPTPPDFLYDLYAVCNHHGGMHGGHYTAFCRNSVDGQWYSYDDSSAEAVPEAEVCTRGAYILFYQRRHTIPSWSASSSVTGSTSSSTSDHWLVRLAEGGSKRGSVGSGGPPPGAQETKQAPASPELPVFREEPPKTEEKSGFEAQPLVRGTPGRSVSMRSPTKPKEPLSKVLPLRWASFGSKDRIRPPETAKSGELVEYLESGRRPRCTKDPIVALVATPTLKKARGADCSSTSNSSLSFSERQGSDSPKAPEGQSRTRDDAILKQKSSKRLRQEHSRTLDLKREDQISHSAPPSRDSTLRRTTVACRAQKDFPQSQTEDRRDGRSHESLLSFFKPGFMKKDVPVSPLKGRLNGHHGKLASGNLSKLSLSNGTLVPEERKANGAAHHHQCKVGNGKAGNLEPVDIQRAHSSSNIQSRMDLTFHRCASLQRNGDIVAAPSHRVLLTDKPGHTTLQRTPLSTSSLVPL